MFSLSFFFFNVEQKIGPYFLKLPFLMVDNDQKNHSYERFSINTADIGFSFPSTFSR